MQAAVARTVLGAFLVGFVPPGNAYGQGVDACRLHEGSGRASFSEAWQTAIASLAHEVEAAPASLCHGTELTLLREGEYVRLTARAPDGRRTSRRVELPAGLSAVAFGLLITAPSEAPRLEPDPLEVPPPDEPTAPRAKAPVRTWDLAVGASAGARVAFGTDVLVSDFDVRADLILHAWVLSVDLRATPAVLAMHGRYDIDSYDEAAVGLGLGRQFRTGSSVVVLSGATSVANVWVENDQISTSAERAQLRLAAVARWSYPVGRAVQLNATLDGEIAPAAFFEAAPPRGLPPFPTVTVGIRLGADMLL